MLSFHIFCFRLRIAYKLLMNRLPCSHTLIVRLVNNLTLKKMFRIFGFRIGARIWDLSFGISSMESLKLSEFIDEVKVILATHVYDIIINNSGQK